jgi:hypothetical protein
LLEKGVLIYALKRLLLFYLEALYVVVALTI